MCVDFRAKQREFAAFIRDPEQNPAPEDVPAARISMYRELFFNNIDNFLSSNFPVLRTILNDQQWFALAQDFFAKHPCKTPYFTEIPEEFLLYLQNERANTEDLPFLLELAHYEWVEMALSIAHDDNVINPAMPDKWLTQTIQLSPLAWSLVYQYPVHKIAPSYLPLTPPSLPTFIVVYRDASDEVNFLEITPMTYRFLELIQQDGGTLVGDCFKQISEESPTLSSEAIIRGGLQILATLYQKGIVGLVAK